eukprot:TRINITY_DN5223_c0_g1_i1.p1 TRINITY_DN5223_c0_g1~~TRINITY_DN5223_c0_g1_i1.p1  ORF type:complete len:267 (-),score=66.45 TRINITY_DN5223_c0_g1_i1:247-1047(-)
MRAGVIRSTAEMISNNPQKPKLLYFEMGFSKTEVNLRRLLAAAPQQQNKAKLIHYVATLRDQLEQLAGETTPGFPQRISKAKVNDFSEKIEALAARIADPPPFLLGSVKTSCGTCDDGSPRTMEVTCHSPTSPGLRRRFAPRTEVEDRTHEMAKSTPSSPNKLDPSVQAHIEKHRKLQEDLTDEMVGLAKQLKESSLVMNQSLQDTGKILDSTEGAIEQSLAGTGHVHVRAKDVYSGSVKTTCMTLFAIFSVTCIFVMVVLLIRLT